eukprot:Nk52_evm63s554 gene=Nk52_evmTU63s554
MRSLHATTAFVLLASIVCPLFTSDVTAYSLKSFSSARHRRGYDPQFSLDTGVRYEGRPVIRLGDIHSGYIHVGKLIVEHGEDVTRLSIEEDGNCWLLKEETLKVSLKVECASKMLESSRNVLHVKYTSKRDQLPKSGSLRVEVIGMDELEAVSVTPLLTAVKGAYKDIPSIPAYKDSEDEWLPVAEIQWKPHEDNEYSDISNEFKFYDDLSMEKEPTEINWLRVEPFEEESGSWYAVYAEQNSLYNRFENDQDLRFTVKATTDKGNNWFSAPFKAYIDSEESFFPEIIEDIEYAAPGKVNGKENVALLTSETSAEDYKYAKILLFTKYIATTRQTSQRTAYHDEDVPVDNDLIVESLTENILLESEWDKETDSFVIDVFATYSGLRVWYDEKKSVLVKMNVCVEFGPCVETSDSLEVELEEKLRAIGFDMVGKASSGKFQDSPVAYPNLTLADETQIVVGQLHLPKFISVEDLMKAAKSRDFEDLDLSFPIFLEEPSDLVDDIQFVPSDDEKSVNVVITNGYLLDNQGCELNFEFKAYDAKGNVYMSAPSTALRIALPEDVVDKSIVTFESPNAQPSLDITQEVERNGEAGQRESGNEEELEQSDEDEMWPDDEQGVELGNEEQMDQDEEDETDQSDEEGMWPDGEEDMELGDEEEVWIGGEEEMELGDEEEIELGDEEEMELGDDGEIELDDDEETGPNGEEGKDEGLEEEKENKVGERKVGDIASETKNEGEKKSSSHETEVSGKNSDGLTIKKNSEPSITESESNNHQDESTKDEDEKVKTFFQNILSAKRKEDIDKDESTKDEDVKA